MLKLKRVDIHGFKSFYDRTDMKFHGSGIAAVVGPNGCGKSNISDAISWVLGEQSAKSLRGTRMEDVIFAGTRERKPLGMAQVTLTMMDPDGHLEELHRQLTATKAEHNASHQHPAEHKLVEHATGGGESATIESSAEGAPAGGENAPNEPISSSPNEPISAEAAPPPVRIKSAGPTDITITRRLYRSGESEYLINGKNARLRDIQDLFSGTGLGPESYAIIEQGRIGQILSNKPADRRAIIEEAAGIGKYKTKKRLAEAKLESSRQNLARVFDILEEVNRQVNSLKRQASKAKRYEELRTEMIAHLRRAISGRFQILEREATALATNLQQAQANFQEITTQLTKQEREHTSVQEACYRTEAELTTARAKVAELNLESERTRGRLELQAKQIAGIDERLAAGDIETQNLDERRFREQTELDGHAQQVAALETEIAAMRGTLQAKTAERDSVVAEMRQRERSIEEARQLVLRMVGEASTLRNQVVQIDEYLAAIERDSARTRRDEDSAVADLARLDQVKEDLSTRLSAQQMELESLADRRSRIEQELQERRGQIQSSRHQLEEIRSTLSRQKARRDSLEEILSHRAYTTESVKRLFTAIEQGHAQGFKPMGVLADFVEMTDPNWEKASETFLHEELEYVVVHNWADAESGIGVMRSEADGSATFLVHDASTAAQSPLGGIEDPAIVGRLSEVLRLTNGFSSAPQGLLPRLANCFLVQEHADAQRLAPQFPASYFLLPDGASYHGAMVTGGRKTAGGPLALKRELRELTSVVEARQSEMDAIAATLEELERSAAQMGEELEHVRAQQQKQEKDALALDHEQRKLAEESARAGQRLSTARLEMERLKRADEQSRAKREESQALVAQREEQRFEQEKHLETLRAESEGLQARTHTLNEEHAVLRAELAGVEERQRSARGAMARLESAIRQIVERREALTRELERMGTERARLLGDNVELDKRAAQLAEESAAATAEVARLTEEETQGRAALAALDESLRALRSESQLAQDRRGAIELELVKKQSDLKHLDETSRKELSVSAADITAELRAAAIAIAAESAGTEGEQSEVAVPELNEEDVIEAEEQSATIRQRIEALGPVNPQALEEFQEASQRYDFLNTQRQDLLDSIRDTEKAIHELDVESRRRFKEAFEVINENFKGMFKTLFGGGQGEMRLTDESNLAESGIDIMASPPGKRLQNVALLSGGEKSLTAMALLMAIFRYTPSPFCILDEVDAPLDEPNIQRLTRLIKEMSDETQFIVITHAKRTMEVAQSLYGVTMQEPGLSTLVSVRFEHPEEARPEQNGASANNGGGSGRRQERAVLAGVGR